MLKDNVFAQGKASLDRDARPRGIAARVGIGTIEILQAGGYYTSRGKWVSIATSVQTAVDGTVEYPPSSTMEPPAVLGHRLQVTVENDTVLN